LDSTGTHPGRAEFPSTRWSLLLADPAAGSAAGRAAFDALARRYWRPIAAYVRARGVPPGDVLDATQDFFAWMLETELLERAEPERGSFRGFLKRCLANFLHDRGRRAGREKRGGGRTVVALSIEDGGGGAAFEPADVAGRSPEEVLDDLWRRELIGHALERLEAELRTRGKETAFALFRDSYLALDELDYAALAARHGVTRTDVSNALTHARKRFRAHVRNAVQETVRDDDALRAELRWLLEEGPR